MNTQSNQTTTDERSAYWPRWLWRHVRPVVANDDTLNTDYGHGYEARQLVDGKWVLWNGDEACDLVCYGYTWRPGARYFKDCVGTRSEIDRKAKHIMAARGVFKA